MEPEDGKCCKCRLRSRCPQGCAWFSVLHSVRAVCEYRLPHQPDMNLETRVYPRVYTHTAKDIDIFRY